MDSPIHWRKRRRMHAMCWARLTYAMRAIPAARRELTSWLYLMEWARLGGQPEEVPHG